MVKDVNGDLGDIDRYFLLKEKHDNIQQKRTKIILIDQKNTEEIIKWGAKELTDERRKKIIALAKESTQYSETMVNQLVECNENWGIKDVCVEHVHLFAQLGINLLKIQAPHERNNRLKLIYDLLLGGDKHEHDCFF